MHLIFNLQFHPKFVNLGVPWEFTTHSEFNPDKAVHVNCSSGFKSVLLLKGRSSEAWPCELFGVSWEVLSTFNDEAFNPGVPAGCKAQAQKAVLLSGTFLSLSSVGFLTWSVWEAAASPSGIAVCEVRASLLLWTTGGRQSCFAEKMLWGKSPWAGGRVSAQDGGRAADDSQFIYLFLTLSVKAYAWEEAVLWKWCNFSKCYFDVFSENREQQDMDIQSSFSLLPNTKENTLWRLRGNFWSYGSEQGMWIAESQVR